MLFKLLNLVKSIDQNVEANFIISIL